MTKTQIIEALKQMTAEERLEIIEAISRMMREQIEENNRRKQERKKRLKAAAEAAIPYYQPGGALYDLWSPESEDYFDSEDNYLGDGVEADV